MTLDVRPSSFASLDDGGAIGVTGGIGLGVIRMDDTGKPRGPQVSLWPSARIQATTPAIAVAGDVLAVIAPDTDPVSERPLCRIGFVDIDRMTSIAEPVLFSDPPDRDSILNEAHDCTVARAGDGFVAAWEQITSNTSIASAVFAQRFGKDGAPVGERLTLATGDEKMKLGPISADSSRDSAVFAFGTTSVSSTFAFVSDGGVTTASAPAGMFGFEAMHDGFVGFASKGWFERFDQSASPLGSVSLPLNTLLAPLGRGYVTVGTDDYLVARAWDSALSDPTDPVSLSDDRDAHVEHLVYAKDGSSTLAFYSEGGKLKATRLGCGDGPAEPPGPKTCPTVSDLAPLDDGCTEEVCHVAIRLDYETLALRGFTSTGGSRAPVDGKGAVSVAQAVFDAKGEYLSLPAEAEPGRAGVTRVFIDPGDFGAFALVGKNSGALIAAGSVNWGGRGQYWVPDAWKAAGDIACGSDKASPTETFFDGDSCSYTGNADPALPTPQAAVDVALRTNLAAHYAARGPFSAFVYLYTPTVGGCNPDVAEYLVVLSMN